MEEMNPKIGKTQSIEEIIAPFADDCADKQELLQETFEKFPILEIRRACVAKIIPGGKDNFLWLAGQVGEYLKIKDHRTALFLLKKIAQYECGNVGGDLKNYDLAALVSALKTWLDEDNRIALKAGLNILFEKIKRDTIYLKEVRVLFQLIFEKYLDKKIEKADEDYRTLDDLLLFINDISGEKEHFISILGKDVVPSSQIGDIDPSATAQVIFEIDRGIVTGRGGYKEAAERGKKAGTED